MLDKDKISQLIETASFVADDPTKAIKTIVKERKPKKGDFQPGNKMGKGRVHGGRNNSTVAIEEVGKKRSEDIMQKAVDLALNGDLGAIKIVLDRVCPPRRGARFPLKLPSLKNLQAISEARQMAMDKMSEGEISIEEAALVMTSLEVNRKMIVEDELLPRIEKLEAMLNSKD